jgi:hypothetical protein
MVVDIGVDGFISLQASSFQILSNRYKRPDRIDVEIKVSVPVLYYWADGRT